MGSAQSLRRNTPTQPYVCHGICQVPSALVGALIQTGMSAGFPKNHIPHPFLVVHIMAFTDTKKSLFLVCLCPQHSLPLKVTQLYALLWTGSLKLYIFVALPDSPSCFKDRLTTSPCLQARQDPYLHCVNFQPPLFPKQEADVAVPSVLEYLQRCRQVWQTTLRSAARN